MKALQAPWLRPACEQHWKHKFCEKKSLKNILLKENSNKRFFEKKSLNKKNDETIVRNSLGQEN